MLFFPARKKKNSSWKEFRERQFFHQKLWGVSAAVQANYLEVKETELFEQRIFFSVCMSLLTDSVPFMNSSDFFQL
jgi:hypothetical protein